MSKTEEQPEIICICGSSKFAPEAAVIAWELEKQGKLVLGLRLLPSSYKTKGSHVAEKEGVAEILDELHLRKIEMSDRIFICNLNGYIGDRTQYEIEYAQKLGKPISYLETIAKHREKPDANK